MNEGGHEVGVRRLGEICVRGPLVFLRYWNLEDVISATSDFSFLWMVKWAKGHPENEPKQWNGLGGTSPSLTGGPRKSALLLFLAKAGGISILMMSDLSRGRVVSYFSRPTV